MGADQNPFSIRTALVSDAPKLSSMMVRSWRESYVDIIPAPKLEEICTVWLTAEKFEERLSDTNACNLIAVSAGEVVGHIYVLPRQNNSLLVAYLYVLKSSARRGIGKTLLSSAIECFPGAAHVELGVLEHNHAAIAFYKAIGFYEAGPEPKPADEPSSLKMTMTL
ncbi:GNAT family N-acetyltransferase [uncultured Maritalea sp.]|jgi:ribosomal protein S18 acetylase RimI-like enzyme|uniref:GNAT family N-acetyltransferase n=1 Tax=uncultured Maritalea sp. TaxID=757249 RepID=UPI0026399B71|nr:GNAT family N-acetyltransferase [uncultured Maritalea sp.]